MTPLRQIVKDLHKLDEDGDSDGLGEHIGDSDVAGDVLEFKDTARTQVAQEARGHGGPPRPTARAFGGGSFKWVRGSSQSFHSCKTGSLGLLHMI